MKMFIHGYPTAPPLWMLILEAADNDPLQAQRIEAEVTETWWYRYLCWRKLYGEYLAEQGRKAKRVKK